jgi:hypothetical protein
MNMQRHLLVMCLVALLCGLGNAQESSLVSATQVVVPRLIRFSGIVKDAGAASTVGITFTLHEGQKDNTALWIETQNVQLDGTGKYTVLLGATKAEGIPTEMFTSGKAQWLGIRVENQPEPPRVLLVSVPYALRAAEADTLAGHLPADFVTTDKLSSAVQQELQQATSSSSPVPGTGKKSGIKASTPTETATDFIDNNGSQVLLVQQNGAGSALNAIATTGLAVTAKSTGTAIFGNSTGTGSSAGVEGITSSPAGRGVYGFNTATTGQNFGVVGAANSTAGIGVFGSNGATTGAATGVWGTTTSTGGIALKGTSTGTSGATTGVLASVKSSSGTAAVLQNSASGKIISGQGGASNTEVFSVDAYGNLKANGTISTTTQVYSTSTSGLPAVFADSNNSTGVAVYGYAGLGQGILGVTNDPNSYAGQFKNILQSAPANPGYALAAFTGNGTIADAQTTSIVGVAAGVFTGPIGVVGANDASDGGYGFGVAGINNLDAGEGVEGVNLGADGAAIRGNDEINGIDSYAGVFFGRVYASGTITGASPIVQAADHPRDPANKILNHAAVVSPEMKNFYDGVITTNADGEALVTLPEYFEDFNRDFRYQLTTIGQFAQAIVLREIQNNQFAIKTDKPNVKVSWLVTGVRNDAFAKAHPLEAETEKSATQRGFYFHPEAYGASKELGIGNEHQHSHAEARRVTPEIEGRDAGLQSKK